MILFNGEQLAYLGDSIYESKIREYLLLNKNFKVNELHLCAIKYTSGEAQSKIIHTLIEKQILTEEEMSFYKKGRNSNHSSNRRNISVSDYKHATGFEALIGYLYLEKKEERLAQIIDLAINIIEEG